MLKVGNILAAFGPVCVLEPLGTLCCFHFCILLKFTNLSSFVAQYCQMFLGKLNSIVLLLDRLLRYSVVLFLLPSFLVSSFKKYLVIVIFLCTCKSQLGLATLFCNATYQYFFIFYTFLLISSAQVIWWPERLEACIVLLLFQAYKQQLRNLKCFLYSSADFTL